MKSPVLLDSRGNPVRRAELKSETAAATMGGVRTPITGYPADGLNPVRLANILRDADAGDPVRYLELAETIEERDLHYLGVLGTRRRSVSQIEISVEAASDDPRDVEQADMVRDWLNRDELAEELFNILDCIGKGYSCTEILWDSSSGQWRPTRLEWRDPRWFRFARHDLATPLMLGEHGQELPLPAFKFIYATIPAKSGLALRSGLARAAAWAWMFKAYTQRDWAIFTQTYGQPLRVGKWGANATEADKETLFRAVANIAGDCAAIIPESMMIEFIETGNVSGTSDLYKQRCDWLDQQVSKAVLGQTATTDAVTGGLGSGKEHRQVQEDIERADARALSAILNRDLVRPWIDLEYGPQERYPRLKIARPEAEDLTALAAAVQVLVPLGMRISAKKTRDRFGLAEPEDDGDVLGVSTPPAPPVAPPTDPSGRTSKIKGVSAKIKRGEALPGTSVALQAEGPLAGKNRGSDPEDELAARMEAEAAPAMAAMLGRIEAMLAAAGSLEEFRAMLLAGFPEVESGGLAAVLAEGLTAADLAGRVAVVAEGD
ncbi:DUF935 domain-containing protein [Paracoccaceae bacterium Fryx2]|nr:DUF935 domain-containing protein [Paracoccaceae bacterium Fryx2]